MRNSSTLLQAQALITRGWLGALSLLCVFSLGSLQAATWQGGNGNWVSDNWGLDTPDGSPGDANYPNEAATLSTAGTLLIQGGDSIGPVGFMFMSVSTINQTGGSIVFGTTIRNRTLHTISGGSATFNGAVNLESGGVYTLNNGTFNATGGIFMRAGGADININGGVATLSQIRMDQDATGNSRMTVTGSAITTLSSTTLVLANIGGSSNMDFVFDASGVKTWQVNGGDASLTLGTGANAANLSVNVSAMLSDGTTGVNLFDYGNPTAVSGAFGTVAITDTTYGTLTLGTQGALNAGEYFLDYGDAVDTDVTLFYNTVPEPGSLALIVAGLAGIGIFRSRQRVACG